MKKLKTYNESFLFNRFDNIYKKVTKDLGINLYFSATFGTAISSFFTFFSAIVKTGEVKINLSDTDIVLLVICSLAILLKENKQNIEKLKNEISERNLSDLIEKFVNTLQNIFKLFKSISETMGKVVNNMVDMFAYSSLFVPFLIGLLDVINLYNLGFNDFNNIMTNPKGTIISASIGVLTLTMKHVINILMKKIARKSKSKTTPLQSNDVVQQFENVEKIYENYFFN
jgi:uncharacterized protein YjgD (DUF1641 family)